MPEMNGTPPWRRTLRAAVLAVSPLLLAAGLSLLHGGDSGQFARSAEHMARTGAGSFLLAGIPYGSVTARLPFTDVAFSLLFNTGISPRTAFLLLQGCLYLLVFLAAGVAGMLLACLSFDRFYGADAEQMVYSLFLVFVLASLALARREKSLPSLVIAALAIGFSLCVRSALFLFPLLVLPLLPRPAGGAGARALRAAFFLALCCVPLSGWTYLNHRVHGGVELFESGRASTNIITGALGSVYTIEGDSRKLAGLDRGTGAAEFFFRETAGAPLRYLGYVLRRLWTIFLMHPLLISAAAAAAFLRRRAGPALLLALPAYFAAVHSLLSIEARYMAPLCLLLPPLITGLLFTGPEKDARWEAVSRGLVTAAAGVLAAAVLLLFELPLFAYPSRALARAQAADTYRRAAAAMPRDRTFRLRACRELWRGGDYRGFYACLRVYTGEFRDPVAEPVLAAVDSSSPAVVLADMGPLQGKERCDRYILVMLRETELGRRKAASAAMEKAVEEFFKNFSVLRGQPYARDRELAERLRLDGSQFNDVFVYDLLLYWPPERALKILGTMREQGLSGGRLLELEGLLREAAARGDMAGARRTLTARLFGDRE